MLLSGVIVGLGLGIAVGRDWRRLARLQIKWLPVLVLALVARAAAPFAPVALALYVAGIVLTGVFAAANWRLPGAPLVALGSLLNLVVIVVNGAMPVDVELLKAAGGQAPTDALHEPIGNSSILPVLADIIIVPFIRVAYSVGDVLIAIGGFLLPFVTLARR